MPKSKPPMKMYPLRQRLPQRYSTEIGRVITRWAHLEWHLCEVVYLLLEVNPKAGRVAVATPRAQDFIPRIKDLLAIRNAKVSVNLNKLKRNLEQIAFFRNALAHGVWVKHDQTTQPVLQITSSEYEYEPGQKAKAKIDPQAVELSVEFLRGLVIAIETQTKVIRKMGREIEKQLATLPRIPPPQSSPNRAALHLQNDKSR